MELTQAIHFEWATVLDDVWNTSPYHVEGLHTEVLQNVVAGIASAGKSNGPSPLGLAILGQRGSGKTHMLGQIREQVQTSGGYFFLVGLLDSGTFWESMMLSMLEGLLRESNGRESQLKIFLRRLSTQVGLSGAVLGAVAGDLRLTPDDINAFIANLRYHHRQVGLACQDTARALVLFASADQALQDIGFNYLQSQADTDAQDRAYWGIQRAGKPAQLLVKELSHLLALTGPSVIAVDQIDTLIAQARSMEAYGRPDTETSLLTDQIANGLMSLRELTHRTISLVTCLPDSWMIIKSSVVGTMPDRFREDIRLANIPTADFGRQLIEKRLASQYREIGFTPRYASWPVQPAAFEKAVDFTPRGLMKTVAAHIDSCLRRGRIVELTDLTAAWQDTDAQPARDDSPGRFHALDTRFAGLKKIVDISGALDYKTDDAEMPALLSAALAAFIEESKALGRVLFQDAPAGKKPSLHARLREDLDEETENETHWAFRAIASQQPVAALNRIRAACTAAGLHQSIPGRKLYLLRNTPWNTGPKTQEALAIFRGAGGKDLKVDEEDLKTFAALKDLLTERDPDLTDWLVERKPASSTKLFLQIFGDLVPVPMAPRPVPVPVSPPSPLPLSPLPFPPLPLSPLPLSPLPLSPLPLSPLPLSPLPFSPSAGESFASEVVRQAAGEAISLGSVDIHLEALRKHTVIFAGSGSGKTVLIRRLIEECALHGVSAIVLDPNNDLARLGDAWPAAPDNWDDNDRAKAERYIANTEVVVWTPRREAGRPVSLKPLPDFRTVLDDKDEFNAAIDSAVAALASRAKVDGELPKSVQSRAVLRETLQHFAKHGGSGLRHLIGMLADLPPGISALTKAEKLAAEMADNLAAAMVNDPLFGGDGEALDPGILLTPAHGKAARISVISFVGLPSDDQRQSFVNQLQMALFAWIKRNPAGDRPLGGLLVMDEAQTLAPSGAMTACTQSTIALASQARKYGLGLVFATQAPKGLHNRIPGNAATQFFGFLNSPVQIAAAREMAQAKGGDVLDISRLRSGQFYACGEGMSFERIETRMCLSYHPRSPLTAEEVIERAQRH